MKTIITAAALVAGALVLGACGDKTDDVPAAEPTAAEMMAPAEETPMASDEAAAGAEDLDPTGNPITMGAPEAADGAEAAPAAE